MINNNLIKDNPTREAIKDLDNKLKRIEKIKQLPQNASIKEIVDTINKITDSIKRR